MLKRFSQGFECGNNEDGFTILNFQQYLIFQIRTMIISKADCPTEIAAPYPGARTRNNPTGSYLSRTQYIDSLVNDWVNHFGDSADFQNTSLSRKTMYLVRHLVALKVNQKVAMKILVNIESRQEKTHENIVRELERMDTDDGDEAERGDEVVIEERNVDIAAPDADADMFSEEENDALESSRVESDLEVAKILDKSDRELFEEGLQLSEKVRRSQRYIDRKQTFIESYMDEKIVDLSSQDILMSYSQNPEVVQHSKAMKTRLSHLTKEEKANKTVLKALNDTIAALQKTPGQQSKDQVKTITAAATHHRWGTASLPDISWRTIKEAKRMKLDVLEGTTSVSILQ